MADTVGQYRKWKLKHPDFPLTVSPNGQWSKKVRGRTLYFGLLSDPDAALQLWVAEKDHLFAGLTPPTYDEGFSVSDLCDKHAEDLEDRIVTGELSPGTRKNYTAAKRFLSGADFFNMPVRLLTPEYFTALQRRLKTSNRSLNTQKWLLVSIKAIFNWSKKAGLLDKAVDYGSRFVAPGLTVIEAEQEENGVIRFFEREVILDILKIADAKMKVAILLGINCAFYPSDTVSITYSHIHLDGLILYHDFRRVKTRRRRMAALWPETVAAIEEYKDCHRPQSRCDNVLLARKGKPYTSKGGQDHLVKSFNDIAEKVGPRTPGVSLGSLRHTYGTVMDLVSDTPMVDLTMGHTSGTVQGQAKKSLQRRIYSQFNMNELKRLKAVADVVHDWLYEGKF